MFNNYFTNFLNVYKTHKIMLFILNRSYKAVWEHLYGLESLADPLVTNENKPIKDQNLSDVKGKH